MYRKNDLPGFLKLVAPEPDEKERIISALKNISADTLVCQGCGKCGCMKPHGTYKRGITYEQNGELVDDFVMIPIFYCTECNYLHAFLTDFLIPFCSFTLLFILGVLKAYLERPRTVTVRAICARYQISSTTLYAWKKRFLCHYTELMDSTESGNTVPATHSDGSGESCPTHDFDPSLLPDIFVHPYLHARSMMHTCMDNILMFPDLTSTFFSRFGFSFLQGNCKRHLRPLPRPCFACHSRSQSD